MVAGRHKCIKIGIGRGDDDAILWFTPHKCMKIADGLAPVAVARCNDKGENGKDGLGPARN